jgi:hypothetical protein
MTCRPTPASTGQEPRRTVLPVRPQRWASSHDWPSPMSRTPFLRFFAHPAVGLIGTAASVLGVGLSFYFYLAAREIPDLSYAINPTKTSVYRAGQTSKLKVSIGGEIIGRDVTALQLAFWNAGRRSIRSGNLLTPLRISLPPNTRILEVQLRRTSRPVTGIQLRQANPRTIELTWRILEQNDGGALQLIYEGNEDAKLDVTAVVEGQPQITRLTVGSWRSAKVSVYLLQLGPALLFLV